MTAEDLKALLQQQNFDVNQFIHNPNFNCSQEEGGDIDVLSKTLRTVRVLAQCTPEDKYFFVGALRVIGAVVMMAGESISDIDALKSADVGIAMDNGCDAAKDNADLVIVKDAAFKNVKDSLMWGRQLYQNVQKFLVFQLTVAFVVAFVTIIGGCIGHVPFNVLQMLWLNLIMDTLGAIALCTEPWVDQQVSRAKRSQALMSPSMWKLVLVQALYQTIVIVVLMFSYGAMAFNPAPNLFTTPLRDENNKATARLKMDTFIFHTFILMCLFNQFNCRNIEQENLNPFTNILNHLFFFFIWVVEIAIQQTMVMYGTDEISVVAALLGTGHLRWWEHMTAYILGALTIGVFVAAKKIPDSAFEWTSALLKDDDQLNSVF